MSYEFRMASHSVPGGKQMVECWRDGKFVAGVYLHQDGIRIVSKFLTDVTKEIEPAYAGGQWVPSATIKLGEKPWEVLANPLTKRELEILRLMAQGRQNKMIAGELGTTINTVKKQITNILSKLGAEDRANAVFLAKERGIL